ncbi:hypothetical protein BVRB_2g038270 isoform A [Beta vulgaris subsp. vulgaris]|nr:hypothetical protein BVRB_2g038270 isoform A [Beta vulgaris subsp. vulgaris]
MAKKKKQVCSQGDQTSSDDCDVKKSNRDDERGRTVLTKVGKSIQNGNKIYLDWHPIRRNPRGDKHLTFTTYIGVATRERVFITYYSWKDVLEIKLYELYDIITSLHHLHSS